MQQDAVWAKLYDESLKDRDRIGPMQYTVEQAEAQFEQLVEKAERGEEVVIVRGAVPIARILPFDDISDQQSSTAR